MKTLAIAVVIGILVFGAGHLVDAGVNKMQDLNLGLFLPYILGLILVLLFVTVISLGSKKTK